MSGQRFLFLLLKGFCFLIPGCSSLVPAPVGDETNITYSIKDEFGTRSLCTLRFLKGPRGLLELVVTERDTLKDSSGVSRGKNPGLFDTTEPVVSPDADGRILASRFLKRRGGSRLVLNEFGPPWLPSYQLTRGRRFDLGMRFGAAIVDSIVIWRNKILWVVSLGGRRARFRGPAITALQPEFLVCCKVINASTRYYSPDSVATLILSATNIPGI